MPPSVLECVCLNVRQHVYPLVLVGVLTRALAHVLERAIADVLERAPWYAVAIVLQRARAVARVRAQLLALTGVGRGAP